MSKAVEWCARAWHRDPTPGEALLIDVVCDGLGTGAYNVPALRGGRVEEWGDGASICYDGYLATWDASELTGLVFAAHDRCARVEITSTGCYLRITVHPREPGDLPIAGGHPALEEAVAAWRERHPLPPTTDTP